MNDLKGTLMAGFDTSARGSITTLFKLLKNPDKMITLKKLIKARITVDREGGNLTDVLTMDAITDLDYLQYCVKEGLRLDPPTGGSIDYKTTQNCTICDVPVPKGTTVWAGMQFLHIHPGIWQQPHSFLPERFDPESELFKTPEGKNRHPLSHLPFSFGIRNCPGQVLAMLEMRVFIAYLLLKMDFELDLEPELEGIEHVSFQVSLPSKLHVRILKLNF